MPALSLRESVPVVLTGYLVVFVFATIFVALGFLPAGMLGAKTEGFSATERLIIAAIGAAPLALGLFWDRLKSIKFAGLELALAELTAAVDVQLATAVHNMNSSLTPELVNAVGAAIANPAIRLVEVNLRRNPYWWSTRLFLLAALAHEYSNIERLVIVANDDDRKFVGLASPVGIREALGHRFPILEAVFADILNEARALNADSKSQVELFGNRWTYHSFGDVNESDFRELVTEQVLKEWLGARLETHSRRWHKPPFGKRMYASILNSPQPYMPLLRRSRLVVIVDRHELTERLAEKALSQA